MKLFEGRINRGMVVDLVVRAQSEGTTSHRLSTAGSLIESRHNEGECPLGTLPRYAVKAD
jgi:hypothetical protein